MTKRVGFTGSQHGSSSRKQLEAVTELLIKHFQPRAEFHYGCCIGWDAEAAGIAREQGYRLYGHPPTNTAKMCRIKNDFDFPPLPYLERNHQIVDATNTLIVAPNTFYEVLRSGTWATARFGVKRGAPGSVVWPDGRLTPLARAVSVSS